MSYSKNLTAHNSLSKALAVAARWVEVTGDRFAVRSYRGYATGGWWTVVRVARRAAVK